MVLGTVENPKNQGDEAINVIRDPASDRQQNARAVPTQKPGT